MPRGAQHVAGNNSYESSTKQESMGPGSCASSKTALRTRRLSPLLLSPQLLLPGSPAGPKLMNSECLLNVCVRALITSRLSRVRQSMVLPLGGRRAQSQVPWRLTADLPQTVSLLFMDCGQTPVSFSALLVFAASIPTSGTANLTMTQS